MFDFFKKLLMSRQMTFERGQIRVGGDIGIMISGAALVHMTDTLVNEMGREGERQMYLSAKVGGESLGRSFKKLYNVSGVKLADLLRRLAEMGGWGEIEFINVDPEGKSVICKVSNSPFPILTKNKARKACHMTRGLLTGGIAVCFGVPVEGVETKCVNEGAPNCEFHIKPVAKFDRTKPFFKQQLFWVK